MDTFTPKRKPLRLHSYDYSQNGAYFFTICLKPRFPILCEIRPDAHANAQVILSDLGKIVLNTWNELPNHNSGISLGPFIVMPDHIHGIISIHSEAAAEGKQPHLPELMRQLKTFSSREINKLRNTPGVPLWQRGYYEHIIRNQDDFDMVAKYIIANPARWLEATGPNGRV